MREQIERAETRLVVFEVVVNATHSDADAIQQARSMIQDENFEPTRVEKLEEEK